MRISYHRPNFLRCQRKYILCCDFFRKEMTFTSQSGQEEIIVPRSLKLMMISMGELLISSGTAGDFFPSKNWWSSPLFLMHSVQGYCCHTKTQFLVACRLIRLLNPSLNCGVVSEFDKLNAGMVGDAVNSEGVQEGWQDASPHPSLSLSFHPQAQCNKNQWWI